MTRLPARFVVWGPRLGGLAMAGFLALFAFDAANGQSLAQTALASAIHLLPSLLILSIVALGWKFEWMGGIGFIALAILYAVMVWRIDWIAAISMPLLLIGLLFCVSWRHRVAIDRG